MRSERKVNRKMTLWEIITGYRKVFIRMYGVARDSLPSLEKELGEKAEYLYRVDHRENRREIF